MAKDMNLALGANVELLKTPLSVMYEKSGKNHKILLLPTKLDSPHSVTLEEMVEEFKSAFGMGDDVKEKLTNSLKTVSDDENSFAPNKFKFQLQSAFLYLDSSTEPITKEYALAISVDTSDALPSLGFVKLNSVYIAVWNTEREAVLRQIGSGNISSMLEKLND